MADTSGPSPWIVDVLALNLNNLDVSQLPALSCSAAQTATLQGNLSITGTLNIGKNVTPGAALSVTGDLAVQGTMSGNGSKIRSVFANINEQSIAAPVSEVAFSNLNLNADKVYVLIAKIANPFATNFDYLLYMNDDRAALNYYSNLQQQTNAQMIYAKASATIMIAGAHAYHTLTIWITRSASGRHVAYGHGGFENLPFNTTNVQLWNFFLVHNQTDNLTKFVLTAGQENGIGAGSHFLLYRGL